MALNENKYALLNERALLSLEAVLQELGLDIKPLGKELQFINPKRNDSDFGSASINTENGIWADFADTDTAKGGDVASLVAWLNDISQSDAGKLLNSILDKIEKSEPQRQAKKKMAARQTNEEEQVVPIPVDAPEPPATYLNFGKPSNVWTYFNSGGEVVCLIYRFDPPQNKKEIRPCTLWRNVKTGVLKWDWKGLEGQRPLYNLPALIERPGAPVLIVEGEKSVDAAAELFPDYVVVTTMGGAPAPVYSDFTPLKGRDVLIWPDNDKSGQEYAGKVIEIFRTQDEEATVTVMQPITYTAAYNLDKQPMIEPGFVPPKGWDAADALVEGWTAAHIKLLPDESYKKSELEEPTQQVVGHKITDEGVYAVRLKDDEFIDIWICSKLEVKALSRDMHSGNWGLLLEFKDKDDHVHKWCMPKSMLVDDRAYRGELLKMGLDIAPMDSKYLSAYLQACNPTNRVLAVKQPGWYKNVYVLPNRVIGSDTESVTIQTNDPRGTDIYQQQGELLEWQENVGKYCIGNSRMILSVCAGLSGPWLKVLAEESGGIHFVGESSSGKTTVVQVAASLWGAPDFVTSWRTTDNALESIAALHNDNTLILDEMSTVDADKAGEIAYMLGNGQGKSRATRSAEIQQGKSWKVVFLSTGEVSLADHMGTANKRTMAGQEVRLVNMPSDGGQNMGLFENIHGVDSPQAFSQLMKNNSATYYGSAGIAMLEALISNDLNTLKAQLKERIQLFITTCVPAGANGQVLRIAQRFGLFAAIGEFAISQGILPWQSGEANAGVGSCFSSWLALRGGIGSQENDEAISRVRRFIEMNGDSRFTSWTVNGLDGYADNRPTINRAGFKRQTGDGRTEYIVFPEAWRTEVCSGLNHNQVTKAMVNAGFLLTNNGQSTHSIRLPGLGKTKRVYIIKADLMGTAEE